MNRTNQILAALLALQIVIAVVVFWPRSEAGLGSGESLFPGLETDQVMRLTIDDSLGEQIQMAKNDAGWVLPKADDYPVFEDRVSELLTTIAGLRTDRLVARTETSHKRLRVADDDFERRIVFELADGTTHTLYAGTSPTFRVSHVRADDGQEVYLVSDFSAASASVQANAWVDTLYLDVPQEQVTTLTLENANGVFTFQKDEAGAWTTSDLAADEVVNEINVNSLVSRLASLRMLYPLGKTDKAEYGLETPGAVLTAVARDESGATKSYTLRIGAQNEDDLSYAASTSESDYYAALADYTARAFIEKTRADFVELPPAPTPAPASEATVEPTLALEGTPEPTIVPAPSPTP